MNDLFQKKLDSIINDIFTVDAFKDYLTLCSKFYHMPYYNQALIFNQNPNATYLAGQSIWKSNFKRELKENSKPILILFPKKDDASMDFDIGGLFDISQTIGDDIDFDEEVDIERKLRENDFLLAASEMSNDTNKKYVVNAPEMTIYYDNRLEGEEYIKTLLLAYVEYKFVTSKSEISYAKQKQQAVNFVITQAFGLDDKYTKFVFINKLKNELSLDELKDFLDDIQLMALEIMRDFLGDFISFEEVCFINQLLDYNKDDFIQFVNNFSTSNKFLDGRLHDIKDKFELLNEENFNKIKDERNNCKIISFPYCYY